MWDVVSISGALHARQRRRSVRRTAIARGAGAGAHNAAMGILEGRVGLITGSSSGIGRGVALAYAGEGASIIVNYPTAAEAESAAAVVAEIEAIGALAIAVEADVADELAVGRLIDSARERFGRIDILVNNAGIAHTAPVEQIDVAQWDRLLAVHLRSVFLTTRLVLPEMYARDSGNIINTTSQLAYKGSAQMAHYVAAKAGIIGFTRAVALEIGSRNVSVNCVAPGATWTPIVADIPAPMVDAVRLTIPKGRLAEIDDIVPTYVFLASRGGRHYQGQCLSPNGGDVFL
jgi:3-oxoacyl-[acyl-carrier protein] reductase